VELCDGSFNFNMDEIGPLLPFKAHRLPDFTHVEEACFQPDGNSTKLSNASAREFEAIRTEIPLIQKLPNGTELLIAPFKSGAKLFHGGKTLIELPESGELLGLGHLSRGAGISYHFPTDYPHTFESTHYTHFWYTISTDEPYRLRRISREFCFRAFGPQQVDRSRFRSIKKAHGIDTQVTPNTTDISGAKDWEHDCESVQFASTLIRERSAGGGVASDSLVVGYGAQDFRPLVISLPLQAVVAMLEPLP